MGKKVSEVERVPKGAKVPEVSEVGLLIRGTPGTFETHGTVSLQMLQLR